MSDYEYHKGKLKRVDLSKFDNSKEKYFETRFRDEFAITEDRSVGMTEEEIQEAYQCSIKYEYRHSKGPWEHLWYDNTDNCEGVIIIGNDLWEVADIELYDNEDVFTKISDDEYEYYTSFHNGGCSLGEVLEFGLKIALKRDKS